MNPSNNDYRVRVPEAESDRNKKNAQIVKRGSNYSKAVTSSNKVYKNSKNVLNKYKVANM